MLQPTLLSLLKTLNSAICVVLLPIVRFAIATSDDVSIVFGTRLKQFAFASTVLGGISTACTQYIEASSIKAVPTAKPSDAHTHPSTTNH